MKQSDQNKIAKRFSDFSNKALNTTTVHLDSKKLLSYLKNIHEIRNITAHSNKFIGFKCKENAHYLNELTAEYAGKNVYAGPTEATAVGNFAAQMIAAGELKDLKAARACIAESFEINIFTSNQDTE